MGFRAPGVLDSQNAFDQRDRKEHAAGQQYGPAGPVRKASGRRLNQDFHLVVRDAQSIHLPRLRPDSGLRLPRCPQDPQLLQRGAAYEKQHCHVDGESPGDLQSQRRPA
jgi:hypothetical protein